MIESLLVITIDIKSMYVLQIAGIDGVIKSYIFLNILRDDGAKISSHKNILYLYHQYRHRFSGK